MSQSGKPVPYINCFEVPAGREAEFLKMFEEVNAYMRSRRGYVSHRLHRSLAADARYRFVNYVLWESVEDFRAAHGEEFRKMVGRPGWREFKATPGLYEVVDEGGYSG